MNLKRGLVFSFVFVILLFGFVSAGLFSKSITGQVTLDSDGWTNWLDRDGPGGSGDWELLGYFSGKESCENPTAIECRTVSGKVSSSKTGEKIVCNVDKGFYCLNSENAGGCEDYEVRFKCEAEESDERISCAAPPVGCDWVGGTKTYCGELICEEDEDVTCKEIYEQVGCEGKGCFWDGDSCDDEANNISTCFDYSNKVSCEEDYYDVSQNFPLVNFDCSGKDYTCFCNWDSVKEQCTYGYEYNSPGEFFIAEDEDIYVKGHELELVSLTSEVAEIYDEDLDETHFFSEGDSYLFGNVLVEVIKIIFSSELDSGIYLNVVYINNQEGLCSDVLGMMIDFADEGSSYYSELSPDYVGNINYYFGSTYLNGEDETYSRYSLSVSDEYSGGSYDYLLSLYFFNNTEVNLSSYLKKEVNKDICSPRKIYGKGEEYSAYVCADIYDIAYGKLNNPEDSDERTVLFYKDNVFVSVRTSQDSFFEEDLNLDENIFSLLGSLKDNNYEHVSFYLPYAQSIFVQDILSLCPSELVLDFEESSNWRCALEPVICPEHGYQTERCVDTAGISEEVTKTISCNPGICSGCYVPRYFQYFNNAGSGSQDDRRCLPYEARFSYFDETEASRLYEINESDGDDYQALFEIYSDHAYLYILDEGELIFEGNLYVDKTYKLDIEGNDAYISLEKIYFVGENSGENYADILIGGSFDAYCDYDGRVKEQKDVNWNNDWAQCQNNFECESNVCSYGECINLRALNEEIRGFAGALGRITCRFSSLFNVDLTYEQCLLDRFGVEK